MSQFSKIVLGWLLAAIVCLVGVVVYELMQPPPLTPQQQQKRLEQLAHEGNLKAQTELCFSGEDGIVATKTWACMKAAEHGDSNALAELHRPKRNTGAGGDCSREYAKKLIDEPADRGNLKSQYWRGSQSYWGGECSGGQSYQEAYFWLSLALKRGPPPANDDTDYAFWRDDAAKHLTPEQVASVNKRVFAWKGVPLRDLEPLKEQSSRGDVKASMQLWKLYEDGADDVFQNENEGMKWLRVAAEQGDATAQQELGWRYYIGKEIGKDEGEAERWFRNSAEQGNVVGQYDLASFYRDKKNYSEAYVWYSLAASAGGLNAAGWRDIAAAKLTDNEREVLNRRIQAWKPASARLEK